MVVNNPRAEFLSHVTESLKTGATITVRGQIANPYFRKIWNGTAKGLDAFEVVTDSRKEGLSTEGYSDSEGQPLKGENNINEIILKKK